MEGRKLARYRDEKRLLIMSSAYEFVTCLLKFLNIFLCSDTPIDTGLRVYAEFSFCCIGGVE